MFHKDSTEEEDKASPNGLLWFSSNGEIRNPDETRSWDEDLPFENLKMPCQIHSCIWSCVPFSSLHLERGYQIVTQGHWGVTRQESSGFPTVMGWLQELTLIRAAPFQQSHTTLLYRIWEFTCFLPIFFFPTSSSLPPTHTLSLSGFF